MSLTTNTPSEKLAHSAIISFLGSGFAAVAALLLTIMVGRALGAEGTGLFYLAVGLFTIASQVLRLGSNSAVIRTIATQRALGVKGHATSVLYIAVLPVLLISLGAAAAIVLLAEPMAGFFVDAGQQEDFASLLRQLAFLISLSAVLAVLQTLTRMLNSVLMFTMLQNVLLPAGRVALVGLALWWGMDAFEVVFAWALSIPFWVLVTVGILLPKLREDRKLRERRLAPGTTREFWNSSASRGVGAALEICLEWVDVLLVAALRSPAEAGIYAVVTRIVRAGQIIDRAMRVAVSPKIAHHLALGENNAVRALHTKATQTMILVAWPFYLTLIFFGQPVLGFFGPEFISGTQVLAVAALGIMILTSTGMLQSLILMGGRSSWQMLVKAISLTLSVGLNIVLIPWWGIMGAAITWTAVIILDASICGFLVYRRMRIGLDLRYVLRSILVALAVFGGGWLVLRLCGWHSPGALLLGAVMLALVYLGAIALLRHWLGLGELKLASFTGRKKL